MKNKPKHDGWCAFDPEGGWVKEINFKNPYQHEIVAKLEFLLNRAKEGKIKSLLWMERDMENLHNWAIVGVDNRYETAGHLHAMANICLHDKLGDS